MDHRQKEDIGGQRDRQRQDRLARSFLDNGRYLRRRILRGIQGSFAFRRDRSDRLNDSLGDSRLCRPCASAQKEKAGPWESPACPCRSSGTQRNKVYPHPSPRPVTKLFDARVQAPPRTWMKAARLATAITIAAGRRTESA